MSKIIKIEQINEKGYALVPLDNHIYLVPNLMIGEKVEIEAHKNGIEVIKRVESSPLRKKVRCPIYDQCGGCQLQHYSYEDQCLIKEKQVKAYLDRHQINTTLLPIIQSDMPFNYRNKIQMVYGISKKKIVAGFYEENTHRIVNANNCDIQDKISNEIINTIKLLMQKHKLTPYDEKTESGIIRHVMIKRSEATKEILVVIVTPSIVFPGRNNLLKDLLKAHSDIKSVIHNINPRKTSVILGDQEKILHGKGYIEDVLLGKKFQISSKTFYQINSAQTAKLYKKAIELLNPTKNDIVLDAYAGVGTIGLILSDYVKKVMAVEINKDAVLSARKNASLNQVSNFSIEQADAKDYILRLKENNVKIDALVVDPPRSGLDQSFIDSVLTIKPKKMVYISCNPETLARDLAILNSVYEVVNVQPLDMFSQTYHVESITLLSLK